MIYFTQWLCENRHTIIAAPWDEAKHTTGDVEHRGNLALASSGFPRRCGICGSEDIRVEHAETPFKSLAQAHVAAMQTHTAQMDTRRRALHARHDQRRN